MYSQPIPPRQGFAKIRGWLRSCAGRIVVPVVALLLGIGLGVLAVFLYAISIAMEGQVLVTPLPPPGGDIVVQIGPAYITRLLQRDLQNSSLPSKLENVRVTLIDSDHNHDSAQVKVSADDQVNVFVSSHITVVVQLLVKNCQIQVHLLHVDLGVIPVTSLAASFEDQINQELQFKTKGLPAGFTYCITDVRTKPQGVFVTLSATPE